MFTRQHYKAIAEIIKTNNAVKTEVSPFYRQGNNDACQFITKDLADYFTRDNERFDRQKFVEACGF